MAAPSWEMPGFSVELVDDEVSIYQPNPDNASGMACVTIPVVTAPILIRFLQEAIAERAFRDRALDVFLEIEDMTS